MNRPDPERSGDADGAAAVTLKPEARTGSLLQGAIVFSAISFLTGLGNLAFQGVLGRHLNSQGQYGDANSALGGLMTLLGLLPSVATFAITHHIAHFKASGDSARLQGLLRGCQRFLFQFTIAGSVLAVLIIEPLCHFFHYGKELMLVTLGCTLLSLWASLVTALCQGLAWFKRLALIGFFAMVLRVGFGWFVTFKWPSAETAVLATAIALLANLILLFWRKELVHPGKPESPWNHELFQYFVVSAACVIGGYCFTQGDLLVMQRYFSGSERDAYATAERLAFALPITVAPLLTVLFTSRSADRHGKSVAIEQLKLLVLYIFSLLIGAVALFLLRHFCVKLILGRSSAEAESMIAQLATTMLFVGLLQALSQWALASRWIRTTILFGLLGVCYWFTLLAIGHTPAAMLHIMPIAAGIAFGILLVIWLITMKRHHWPAAES